MVLYYEVFENSSYRIDDLEKEISKQEHEMSALEAKIFYDDLMYAYEKMIAYETQIETNPARSLYLKDWLHNNRKVHLKVTNLKIKLMKILSSAESTPSSVETNVNNQSNHPKQSETVKNLDLQIRNQSFLIKRIESLEIHENICSTKAEVMYNHLSQLYDSFISNQMQIEANVDDDASLDDQQKITAEIQRKVVDSQTKLKKIIQPIASTSLTKSTNTVDHTLQTVPAKQVCLIRRIFSLRPELNEHDCPEKAEILYNRITSLYELFDLNQMEIESRVSNDELDAQRQTSDEMQKRVFEYQATYKKIFAPIKGLPPSSTPLETFLAEQIKSSETGSNFRTIDLRLSNLITLCHDLLQYRIQIADNLSGEATLKDIASEIQQKAIDFQTKMNEIRQLTESTSMTESKEFSPEEIRSSQSENIVRMIELQLSHLTNLSNNSLESRSDEDETGSTISNTSNYLEDHLKTPEDIQQKVISLQTKLSNFLDAKKLHEKNALDKLEKIVGEMKKCQKAVCKSIDCNPINGTNQQPCIYKYPVYNTQEIAPISVEK